MAIACEVGDVGGETIESWNERAREVTKGWKPENVWNMLLERIALDKLEWLRVAWFG